MLSFCKLREAEKEHILWMLQGYYLIQCLPFCGCDLNRITTSVVSVSHTKILKNSRANKANVNLILLH